MTTRSPADPRRSGAQLFEHQENPSESHGFPGGDSIVSAIERDTPRPASESAVRLARADVLHSPGLRKLPPQDNSGAGLRYIE